MKLYILVREDLDVSIGKLMVHVGHICTHIVNVGHSQYWKIRNWIEHDYHTIIILKVKNLEELKKYYIAAEMNYDILEVMIEDAGFYEVPKGTILMCGIGPISDDEAEDLGLKKLSLFKK